MIPQQAAWRVFLPIRRDGGAHGKGVEDEERKMFAKR